MEAIRTPLHLNSPTNLTPTLHPTLHSTQNEFSEIHPNSLSTSTTHPPISPVQIQPKILHFIPFISSVSFFPPSHNTHHSQSPKHTNTAHLNQTSIAFHSTWQLSPPMIRTLTQQPPLHSQTPSHPLLVTLFPPLSAKTKRFNRSRIAQWKSNRPFQSHESLVDVSSILTSALFFSSIKPPQTRPINITSVLFKSHSTCHPTIAVSSFGDCNPTFLFLLSITL